VLIGETPVPATHQVVRLVLDDGRVVFVSPGHPTADGRRVGDLNVGGVVDASRVVSADRVAYAAGATFDVLPRVRRAPTGRTACLLALPSTRLSGTHQLLTRGYEQEERRRKRRPIAAIVIVACNPIRSAPKPPSSAPTGTTDHMRKRMLALMRPCR